MKTALLSAYDKNGLAPFARQLAERGWQILASSGTARHLAEQGIASRDVSEIVGEPILGHRVVTLSREIHAALLATETAEDQAELLRLGVPRIDLVYVNLYPLREEIARPGATIASVIEKTDIGGPTLLRSAAKGRRIVLTRHEDLDDAIAFIDETHPLSRSPERFISRLAAIAEREVSAYCAASAAYLEGVVESV